MVIGWEGGYLEKSMHVVIMMSLMCPELMGSHNSTPQWRFYGSKQIKQILGELGLHAMRPCVDAREQSLRIHGFGFMP